MASGQDGLGARIRAARKAAGLTQKQLAALVDTTGDSVSHWERELHQPDGKLPALLKVLPELTLADVNAEPLAEAYTLEAALDALRKAEKEMDRARAIIRQVITTTIA